MPLTAFDERVPVVVALMVQELHDSAGNVIEYRPSFPTAVEPEAVALHVLPIPFTDGSGIASVKA